MPARRKERPSSFWQRLWRSRLNSALGRLCVQRCRLLQRCGLNLRLDSALDIGARSCSRRSLRFPQRQKFSGWYIGCSLRYGRNVERAIRIPDDEITSRQRRGHNRNQEFCPIGESIAWPRRQWSRHPLIRLERGEFWNGRWHLSQRQPRDCWQPGDAR